MSIEIFVLSDRQLSTIDEWQQAIERAGFSLVLNRERPIAALRGYLPAQRGAVESGFECDHFDAAELMDEIDDVDFGRRWKYLLAFRMGGDFNELLGAYIAAAAYAQATDGVVFDSESGEILTPEKAAQEARNIEIDLPKMEAAYQSFAQGSV
jgi:hypothetical protein